MQAGSTQSGEMSQDSIMSSLHRMYVTSTNDMNDRRPADRPAKSLEQGPLRPIDPVARQTKRAYAALALSSVGLEFGLSVAIGALFGYWLDTKAGTTPWLMILFLLLGFAAGVRALVRETRRLDRAEQPPHDGGARA
jgi:F0F1-type ATP synthase assembly protein I